MILKHLTRSSISVQSAGPAVASSRSAASAAIAAGRRADRTAGWVSARRDSERGGEREGWMRYGTFCTEVGPTVLSVLNTDCQEQRLTEKILDFGGFTDLCTCILYSGPHGAHTAAVCGLQTT